MPSQIQPLRRRLAISLLGAAALWLALPAGRLQAQFQSSSDPVRATMKADKKEVSPGGGFEIRVTIRIAKDYHIYGDNGTNLPFIPTTLNLTLPKDLELAGDWSATPSARAKDGAVIYTNTVVYRRALKVKPGAPLKTLTVAGQLRYQACNQSFCFPPGTIALETRVAVVEKTALPPAAGPPNR